MFRKLSVFVCLVAMVFASDDGLDLKESTIPVVDLQDYFNPDTKEKFIEDVRAAFHKVGFLGVKNTKVNQEIIDKLYAKIVEFFAFDVEDKMKVSAALSDGQRGFTHFGSEFAQGSNIPEPKEYYMMGRDLCDEDHIKYNIYKNSWPEFMDFKKPAQTFYNHLEEYSVLFQEIFSLALNQDKAFLNKICSNGDTSCRMIHYPNIASKEGVFWAGAHTDVNLFTILPKATAAGLEVKDENGKWIPVFVKEDAFIINAGDFLEIISNGYFKSSLHRVKKPENMDQDRYSCVFFVHPRSEANLFPLNEWIEKTGGRKNYIKATRWEMLMERLVENGQATDGMLKELGESGVMERLMKVDRASVDAMKALRKAGYASDKVLEKLEELEV
ncbi:MAG: hypothetical protein S4CHLAM20_03760 [Chlamydiia bacterium]|nr:hypothetical protein [Chlamydiia bacterium]